MRLALDTNRYRDLADGREDAVHTLERADAVLLPFVVLAELRAGFAVGAQGDGNERALQRFLGKPGVGVLYAEHATTHMASTSSRSCFLRSNQRPPHSGQPCPGG